MTSPTSRPTRRRSRDTATTVDLGDAALYQRRRLVASTRDAASYQRRRFAATGQGHRATHFTRRYLLYIYCLLIRSAKNLISLLLKNRLFNSLPHAICMHDHNVVITLSINCRDDCSSDRYLSSHVLAMQCNQCRNELIPVVCTELDSSCKVAFCISENSFF